MQDKRKIVIGIGGSSGSIYAKLLLDELKKHTQLEVGVVMTDNALINWEIELGKFNQSDYPFTFYAKNDFMAPFASGSAQYTSMVICPCSMGLLARVAHGLSQDLICRAADVMLKEGRQLIVVPRETPYSLIHLRNMTTLAEAGATLLPATPSFYSKPTTVDEVCMTVVSRIIDRLGIEQECAYRWGD